VGVPAEICLLLSAQLAISARLLERLIVKPGNMPATSTRAGGVVLSEAVMMALAPKLGRGQAHELVRRLLARASDRACLSRRGAPEPGGARHASPRRIAQHSTTAARSACAACSSTAWLRDWRRGERAPGNDGPAAGRRTASRPLDLAPAGSGGGRRIRSGSRGRLARRVVVHDRFTAEMLIVQLG
jgi:hypothetical protein